MSVARIKARHPVRTCIGCGTREPQAQLLRLQVPSSGGLELVERPVRGRSAYVHDRRQCIEAVVKSRILRRSLRVDVPRALRAMAVERFLQRETDQTTSLPGAHGVRTYS